MSLLPNDAKKIDIENSTVDFYKFIQDGLTYYYFDTSMCGPPEPMVNAMLGLQLLKEDSDRLVMINHTSPNGLFPKIENNFGFEVNELPEEDKVKIVFNHKSNSVAQTDFSNNKCSG